MSKPAAIPGARATLLLSLAMSLIGVGGTIGAYGILTIPPSEMEPVELVPGTAEATSAMFTAMAESPPMKALQVGNLLASGLLIISSLLLTVRRETAIWWAKQALVANVLYTLANAIGTVWFAHGHPELVDAMFTQSGQAVPEDAPTLLAHAIGTSCGASIMVGLYAVMLRIALRPDVRSFVSREAS
ncbi:MAG: hypothetical protein H6719_19420 [Sandaracinaceae bacterium]|nr:hypothetical protein [Sandaracinaceae bacterium]